MRKLVLILSLIPASAAIAGAVGAQPLQLAMLDGLERGSWELKYRDDQDAGTDRVCLSSGRELVQLRHARLKCRTIVVDDTPNAVTVQYSCPGNGYGRTHIRRESNQLVQIDTQGIENGLPFAYAAEARRVGACSR